MAAKPRSQWSAAYRRRIENFEKKHPGAPRHVARGKPAQEHVIRAMAPEARAEALAQERLFRRIELAILDAREREETTVGAPISFGGEDGEDGITIADGIAIARESPSARRLWERALRERDRILANYRRSHSAGSIGIDALNALALQFFMLGIGTSFFWYH